MNLTRTIPVAASLLLLAGCLEAPSGPSDQSARSATTQQDAVSITQAAQMIGTACLQGNMSVDDIKNAAAAQGLEVRSGFLGTSLFAEASDGFPIAAGVTNGRCVIGTSYSVSSEIYAGINKAIDAEGFTLVRGRGYVKGDLVVQTSRFANGVGNVRIYITKH